ncbi:hypothetical protein RB200_19485 [Streptomyces sp. PmtG]
MAPTLTVPRDADELTEALGDTATLKDIVKTPEALRDFIVDYAKGQARQDPSIEQQVRELTQKEFANALRGDQIDKINRLNLDPTGQPVARSKALQRQGAGREARQAVRELDRLPRRYLGRGPHAGSIRRPFGDQADPERVRV